MYNNGHGYQISNIIGRPVGVCVCVMWVCICMCVNSFLQGDHVYSKYFALVLFTEMYVNMVFVNLKVQSSESNSW